MRRLLLLRHAKAVAPSFDDDFGRELTERGRNDARRIGDWIASEALTPDLCIYSGAARTRETCEIVAAALPRPVETIEENALYDASNPLILHLLRALPDRALSALVVGHNPGIGEVASLLSGDGLAGRFSTAALAVITFDGPDWACLAPRSGRLEWFVTPRDI
jgi:phosphohistidine phosphatase